MRTGGACSFPVHCEGPGARSAPGDLLGLVPSGTMGRDVPSGQVCEEAWPGAGAHRMLSRSLGAAGGGRPGPGSLLPVLSRTLSLRGWAAGGGRAGLAQLGPAPLVPVLTACSGPG